jgi:hypothetical protein
MRSKAWIAILVLCALTACKTERAAPTAKKKAKAATSTEVTVRITGLTSYADNPVDVAEGALQPMTMYMLNARNAHHPHVPIMMYERKYNPTSPSDQRGTFREGNFTYFPLIGEELTFDGAKQNTLSYETEYPVGCKNIDKDSIYWIPKISQIAKDLDGGPPDQDDLDDRYFYRAPNPKRIGAFVDLSYGTLVVKPTIPLIWEFKTADAATTLTQPSVQVVYWTFTIQDEFLVIRSRRFEPAGSLPEALLRLQARDGKIVLTLANVVPDDIKRLANGTSIPAEETDPHFANYYQVVKDPKGTLHKRIPHIYGMCVEGEVLKADTNENRCLMRQFVRFDPEPTCVVPPPPPATLGGVNCIPNRLP